MANKRTKEEWWRDNKDHVSDNGKRAVAEAKIYLFMRRLVPSPLRKCIFTKMFPFLDATYWRGWERAYMRSLVWLFVLPAHSIFQLASPIQMSFACMLTGSLDR
ncbi:hypothetical protein BX616_010801 [Lobosporangium transversale]|uniref:Uncharacterized protein n=1 Tax=Lobosporangium transversale TaxID=64571 RepID=A0A1Y2GVB3_9FUNG|nr:hypothetical protein BCR41DRAFT_368811 [Lobosporangium transversale]KAF9910679.1 hypothetical protein BX616_010801 [Lobosporangium transversale]ORZ25003.1 hypothetical protein BCR41DRAFT_368811 [Lobosporangium transversale]|eukprot:XP_021883984.1 hypothetical protein BCR41DRAFT_368811 [Lobosporangium transversale]